MLGVTETMIVLTLSVSPVIMLMVHMILSRHPTHPSRQVVAFHAVCLTGIPLAAFLFTVVPWRSLTGIEIVTAVLYAVAVYAAISIVYFHFFNMSETARRIRILCEIDRAGSLSPGEMEALYKTADIIDLRLERMVSMGQLKSELGYYSVDGKALYWSAMIIFAWRRVLGFERDG